MCRFEFINNNKMLRIRDSLFDKRRSIESICFQHNVNGSNRYKKNKLIEGRNNIYCLEIAIDTTIKNVGNEVMLWNSDFNAFLISILSIILSILVMYIWNFLKIFWFWSLLWHEMFFQ